MAKFKVDQKVRIRHDIQIGEAYGMEHNPSINDLVSDSMIDFAGKIVTIESIGRKYRMKEVPYNWTDGMLEEIIVEKSVADVDLLESIGIHVTKVIYSEPATIIFYKKDPTNDKEIAKRSVAKCGPKDKYDKEAGYKVAVLKAFRKEINKQLRNY